MGRTTSSISRRTKKEMHERRMMRAEKAANSIKKTKNKDKEEIRNQV